MIRSHGGEPPATAAPADVTILLAEDDGSVRRLTAGMLAAFGYRVLEAGDGEEALALAALQPGRIDLLLTDVKMPRLGGCQLAARLGEQRPDMAVLYMSGYADGAIDESFLASTRACFLAKPFRRQQLAEKVREALALRSRAASTTFG